MLPTICLDLGRQTGYAIHNGKTCVYGLKILCTDQEQEEQQKQGKERTGDLRYQRLKEWLLDTIQHYTIRRVVFEDVVFATSTAQVQLWSSLRTALWDINLTHPEIEVQCIPVSTLKVFATGNGHADKDEMCRHYLARYPTIQTHNDNIIDALWILEFVYAVDRGEKTWGSIWERRMERKKTKRERQKAKNAAKKQKQKEIKEKQKEQIRQFGETQTPKLTKTQQLQIFRGIQKGELNYEGFKVQIHANGSLKFI